MVAMQQNAFSLAGLEGPSMRTPLVVLVGIAVIVACASPTSVCGCSPAEPAGALVVGTVRTSEDSLVRGALLSTRFSLGSCQGRGPATTVGAAPMPSDSTGRYRVSIVFGAPAPDTICVQVVAYRSATMRRDTLVSQVVPVAVRAFPPYDSTRIDFRFP